MSWYQPRRKNTPYNHKLGWGNDNDIRFFVKPSEQKNSKTQVESVSTDSEQKPKIKKEKQKKTEEKTQHKKKVISEKKKTKNKTKKQIKTKPKTKIQRKAPTTAGKVTKDNFI